VALHEKAIGYRVGAVISNKADAGGLEWARKHGIPTHLVLRRDYQSLQECKQALLETVQNTSPDLVALAGFMMILQPDFVDAFEGRLLNIHPSLLPKYPGLDTHARALQAGDSEHGCSVHFVEAGLDSGPVVAQARIPVLSGDTADSLAARLLPLEHKLYPWVIRRVADGSIRLTATGLQYSDEVCSEATSLGFILPRHTDM
jgi:phosphoribosylglycinamide formyltransferase-1